MTNKLHFILLLETELHETVEFINELLDFKSFEPDVRNAPITQISLNISIVISYSRNFKYSRGWKIDSLKDLCSSLIQDFTMNERVLHEKIIALRDEEFAHSDSRNHDIQSYNDEDKVYSYSKRVVREILEKKDLILLKEMINKISFRVSERKSLLMQNPNTIKQESNK